MIDLKDQLLLFQLLHYYQQYHIVIKQHLQWFLRYVHQYVFMVHLNLILFLLHLQLIL